MLNLYDYLTPLDNKRIENYIQAWGVESGYIGNEKYLSLWKDNNKKLFHLLGGELIVRRPFSYEKPQEQLENELSTIVRVHRTFFNDTNRALDNFAKENMSIFNDIRNCFCQEAFIRDEVLINVKYKRESARNTLQIQRGMKPIRALQKIIQYFDLDDEIKSKFETFRVAHSMVLNEKVVKGTLCISIHPLDFMTMSDNASDWSSCMSWMEKGCYHVGTIEMMNSNNVVCAYLESSSPFHFNREFIEDVGEEWTWNNKKWRQLFYVTKDIIVGGKAYPYKNLVFTEKVLEILRELAEKNLKWTYSFSPERYKDMIHVGSLYRMDKNREWIRGGNTFKHNILFDSKGMYNDMLNDNNYEYLCIRNKVKKTKIISYSGKTSCVCCSNPVVEQADDYYYHNEGSYNERFKNVNTVLCEECLIDRDCDWCGNEHGYSDVYKLGSQTLCKQCWESSVRICPECGKPYQAFQERGRDGQFTIHLDDSEFCLQDLDALSQDGNEHFAFGCACRSCRDKMEQEGILEWVTIKVDRNRQYFGWHTEEKRLFVTNKVVKDADFIKKYSYSNLTTPEAKDYLD